MGKDTADMSDINSQVCQYKEGKELFTYLADLKLADVWKLNARFGTQSTSASCCKCNWSTCEYIFSKRRYCLANELAEKLVRIHGAYLRNIENSKEFQKDTDSNI